MKLFQVLLLSLLLLIFGALVGIFTSISDMDGYFEDDDAILLDDDDFEELGIPFLPTFEALEDDDLVSSSFVFYTIDSFKRLIGANDDSDIIEILESNEFEFDYEDEHVITFYKEGECRFDEVHNTQLCGEELIHVNLEHNEIIVERLIYEVEEYDDE